MLPTFSPHQSNGIDVEQQCSGAALVSSFGIEEMHLAKRQLERMHPLWILVEEVAQIRSRLVSCGYGQQHKGGLYGRTPRGPSAVVVSSNHRLLVTRFGHYALRLRKLG